MTKITTDTAPDSRPVEEPIAEATRTSFDNGAAPPWEDEPEDPFADLSKIRLSQDFSDTGVQKVLLRVPVRKPHRQEFVRVHPDPAFAIDAPLIESGVDREWFMVSPDMTAALVDEIRPTRLYTTVNRQGVVSLWPCRLPGTDGRVNPWHTSAREIAELAKTVWLRMAADQALGAYQASKAVSDLGDPAWPNKSLSDLLRIAFGGDSLIRTPDHPLVRRLMGQV